MGFGSWWHWFILVLFGVVLVVPYWKIFKRAGWPGPVALLMLLPFVNFVLLWIVAFKRWPGDER